MIDDELTRVPEVAAPVAAPTRSVPAEMVVAPVLVLPVSVQVPEPAFFRMERPTVLPSEMTPLMTPIPSPLSSECRLVAAAVMLPFNVSNPLVELMEVFPLPVFNERLPFTVLLPESLVIA
ncbi:MAG: hypothetical protein U1F77_13645 [Kiritimatiellia bacterium]